jgi:hypothetical protein
MARTPGSQNRPGSAKPGRKPNTIDPQYTTIKNQVIEAIETEHADNLTEAAKYLDIKPSLLYHLKGRDKAWSDQIEVAQNVVADKLEAKLDKMNSPVAAIFRLKKLRIEYRDNFKFDFNTDKLEKLLTQLVEVGKTSQAVPPKEETNAPKI